MKNLLQQLRFQDDQNQLMKTQKKASSHASSVQEQVHDPWLKVKRYFCPCLLPRSSSGKLRNKMLDTASVESSVDKDSVVKAGNLDINGSSPLELRQSKRRRVSEEEYSNSRRQAFLQRESYGMPKESFRETMNIELVYNNRMRSMQQFDWRISTYPENYLLSIGNHEGAILARVAPVNISIDPDKFKKQMAKSVSKKDKNKNLKFDQFQFDKFWNQRYQFFERFDQGIKIKQESWSRIPYECVAEHIASKCNGAKMTLDAFAGVGSLSIKMANINSCGKVIANQVDKEKLSFLLNNATIYQVDNYLQLSNFSFMTLNRKGIDVVMINPPLNQYRNTTKDLEELIAKSMSLAPNFLILLPPDTNIEALAVSIYRQAEKYNWMKDFCSIKIEKIYNKTQLKYILICAGKLVQPEVKLNDELQYIYGRLKKFGEKVFKHKKIIKKIREDHGMLRLLSLVRQSQMLKKEAFLKNPVTGQDLLTVQFFYDLIIKKKLISPQRLNKIRQEQDESLEKAQSLLFSGGISGAIQGIHLDQTSCQPTSPVMQQQKVNQNPFTIEPQLTSSQYSYLSYLQSMANKKSPGKSSINKVTRSFAESDSGVIIKRSNAANSSKVEIQSIQEGYSQRGEYYYKEVNQNNIVTVNSKNRSSDVTETKKEEVQYRKKTTFAAK